ncbi:MAG: 6,7-dimethyl-8-ribityllumazine synthase [Bacteroidales bacterium]
MSVKNKNLSTYDASAVPDAAGMRIAIVFAGWNKEITGSLLEGALQSLELHGLKQSDIRVYQVPGSFELPAGAALLIKNGDYDAVICLGCIIQGETRHFEFIAQAVANGCTQLSVGSGVPVVFGVLTTDTFDQARQRAGGAHGNKGNEAAVTAIQMAALKKRLSKTP